MLARVLVAGGALGLTTLLVYVRYLHDTLAKQVTSTAITAAERKAAYSAKELECIPTDLVENPQNYRILHERDEKHDNFHLPQDEVEAGELFTKLMQRNMSCFARMPGSWALRLLATDQEQRRSFSRSHNLALRFEKGDLSCGVHRVVQRTPLQVVFVLEIPKRLGSSSARMMLSLLRQKDGTVLRSEFLQWTKAEDSTVLPLERSVAMYMHEVGSWWLLVTGAQYLRGLVAK